MSTPQPTPAPDADSGPEEPFAGAEVLLGVCGGVAAYKAAALTSLLVQGGANVSVILTESATHFIGKTTFEALTGRPVYGDGFKPVEHYRGEHIGLAERADVCVVAPATAQFLAKLAHGFADALLTTTLLVRTCPLVVAPAMNCDMWAKPAVQRNRQQAEADGAIIVEPGEGWLSCGRRGAGRLAEPDAIRDAIATTLRFARGTDGGGAS